MNSKERANSIMQDILVNHLPRVQAGFEQDYVDENQILVIYDHAVRARILIEQEQENKQLLKRMERMEKALRTISVKGGHFHKLRMYRPYCARSFKRDSMFRMFDYW